MVTKQSRKGQQAQRKHHRKWGLRDRFPSLNLNSVFFFFPSVLIEGLAGIMDLEITSGKISTLNLCVPT